MILSFHHLCQVYTELLRVSFLRLGKHLLSKKTELWQKLDNTLRSHDYFVCVCREVYCLTVKIGSMFFLRLCSKIINHWMSILLRAYRSYLARYQIVLHQLWHLQFRYSVYCMIYSLTKHRAYSGAICRSDIWNAYSDEVFFIQMPFFSQSDELHMSNLYRGWWRHLYFQFYSSNICDS